MALSRGKHVVHMGQEVQFVGKYPESRPGSRGTVDKMGQDTRMKGCVFTLHKVVPGVVGRDSDENHGMDPGTGWHLLRGVGKCQGCHGSQQWACAIPETWV